MMSSSYGEYPPKLAVDGNLNGDVFHKSCAHSLAETDPWLRVDLQQTALVERVKLIKYSETYLKWTTLGPIFLSALDRFSL